MRRSIKRGFQSVKRDGIIPVAKRAPKFLKATANNVLGSKYPLNHLCYWLSKWQLASLPQDDGELNQILINARNFSGAGPYYTIAPMQENQEVGELAQIVADRNPHSVVEIGSAYGGTLFLWSRYLNPESITAIDISPYFKVRSRLWREFNQDVDYTFLNTSSQNESVRNRVKDEHETGVDFLFIDGDHTYDGVKQDFELYSPLVNDGGIIAFHDIIEVNEKPWMGVPQLWDELKSGYETEEIILPPGKDRGGIGVVYWESA